MENMIKKFDSVDNINDVKHQHHNRSHDLSKQANTFIAPLSQWWTRSARDLPWRFHRTDAWGILLSEVMSQQTPMTRVEPYWRQWIEQWPRPEDLAQASPAEVITAWGTLGYPRRALRLRECAQHIVDFYNGQVPDTYDDLIQLPGIGDYTASAILSFAYGQRIVVIDTNIRRVVSRAIAGVESHGGSATAGEKKLAHECLPQSTDQSIMWNQAVMELGATICTAQNPLCDQCPLRSNCAFARAGWPGLGTKRTRPKQSFTGTNRQVRGIILKALRHEKTHELAYEDVLRLWNDRLQLDLCIATLDEDGLIVIHDDHRIALP